MSLVLKSPVLSSMSLIIWALKDLIASFPTCPLEFKILTSSLFALNMSFSPPIFHILWKILCGSRSTTSSTSSVPQGVFLMDSSIACCLSLSPLISFAAFWAFVKRSNWSLVKNRFIATLFVLINDLCCAGVKGAPGVSSKSSLYLPLIAFANIIWMSAFWLLCTKSTKGSISLSVMFLFNILLRNAMSVSRYSPKPPFVEFLVFFKTLPINPLSHNSFASL